MDLEEKGQLQPKKTEGRKIWHSCCFNCDPEPAKFITKTVFAGVILAFSGTMIATNSDPCNPLLTWYTSLIGLVAGSYIEQTARMKKE
jgi:hypothetical protein